MVLTLSRAQGGAARAARVRTASCSAAMSASPCPTVAAVTMESTTKRGRRSTPQSRRCASVSLVALWSAKILPVLTVAQGRSLMVSSSVPRRCPAPVWPQVTDRTYVTFDGMAFNMTGTCSYVLTQTCTGDSMTSFIVTIQKEARQKRKVSRIQAVSVEVYGVTLTLKQGKGADVMVR